MDRQGDSRRYTWSIHSGRHTWSIHPSRYTQQEMPSLPPPITSRTNARVKALRASLSGKAARPGDLLGIEGLHLIGELHHAGHSFDTVYVRQGDEALLEVGWPGHLRAAHWVVLSHDVFASAVTTQTPQGIAATWLIRAPLPPRQDSKSMENRGLSKQSVGNALILENLQDPGNLGTLIRSAAAFGTERVFLTPESANHWNPKVVRAAAGAVFQTAITRVSVDDAVAQLHSEGVRVFAAVSGFHSGPRYGGVARLAARHGVLTGRLNNPEAPAEFQHCNPSTSFDLLAPPDLPDPVLPESGKSYAASFSCDTDFVEPCAILIGNEGAGLTQHARALADEQVQIPVCVESLNAAVAGAVLLYEVMRQRELRVWARQRGLRP